MSLVTHPILAPFYTVFRAVRPPMHRSGAVRSKELEQQSMSSAARTAASGHLAACRRSSFASVQLLEQLV